MKQIRKSKIDYVQKMIENESKIDEINRKFDLLTREINELQKIKDELIIDNDFTEDEFNDTMNFVIALNNEEYEKLTEYKINNYK